MGCQLQEDSIQTTRPRTQPSGGCEPARPGYRNRLHGDVRKQCVAHPGALTALVALALGTRRRHIRGSTPGLWRWVVGRAANTRGPCPCCRCGSRVVDPWRLDHPVFQKDLGSLDRLTANSHATLSGPTAMEHDGRDRSSSPLLRLHAPVLARSQSSSSLPSPGSTTASTLGAASMAILCKYDMAVLLS